MNNKNTGKGLEMVIQKLKFFRNWLHLPPKCPLHGRQHLFAQRTWTDGEEKVSYKCMVGKDHWSSEIEKSYFDWISKRDGYLSDNGK